MSELFSKTTNADGFRLVIAPREAQEICLNAGGGDGQGSLINGLERQSLAKDERGHPRGCDHVHLSRFDGTNYCQWYGRYRSGYHHPIGRIMEIVELPASPTT